jgi:hypothetical protein
MADPRIQIRPHIPIEPTIQSPEEQFQNQTLRPILKLQNGLLLAIFRQILQTRKVQIDGLSEARKRQEIEHRLSKDNKLRYLLLGAVIGQFTVEEYETYLQLEQEGKRRIFSMLEQRLKDQLIHKD